MTLPVEHIKEGAFIWYSGATSMWDWDCPALIHAVDTEKQLFWVTSLDDLKKQKQAYDFELQPHSPTSRETMRAIEPEEARAYLEAARAKIPGAIAENEEKINRLKLGIDHLNERSALYDELIEKTKA